MKKIVLLCFLTVASLSAQVSQQWVSTYNGPSNRSDEPRSMLVDAAGNVYVTGLTSTNSFLEASDFATIKYNSLGVQQWVANYNGPASPDSSRDIANSIAVDNSGNLYVTGSSYGGASRDDFVTIKYNSNGIQRWVKRYNDSLNSYDGGIGIAVDGSGNVYATGTTVGSGFISQITTIKYDSTGIQQWIRMYIGSGDMNSSPAAIKLDASGNVYVTGSSNHLGSNDNYVTVKYNSSGALQWARSYNGTGNIQDNPYALAIDTLGNVYVTGASWGVGSNLDYLTIKYNSSGVEQWTRRHNGAGNSTDIATAIAVDNSGNIFVTGECLGIGTTYDFATIKYNPNGDSLWVRMYDYGPGGNRFDGATGIALDRMGNVYVTGTSSSSLFDDYVTIKYSSFGNQLWLQRFNGAGNNSDDAVAIAVDNFGNVYVTGKSWNDSSNNDYATVRYSQLVSVNQNSNTFGSDYFLYQNYPNPFNPNTIINYQCSMFNYVLLSVYDILGNEVETLVNKKQNAGSYSVKWDAANFPSGIYYYKLTAGNYSDTKKMILLK